MVFVTSSVQWDTASGLETLSFYLRLECPGEHHFPPGPGQASVEITWRTILGVYLTLLRLHTLSCKPSLSYMYV